jgi:molecular chaperone GrpE
MKNSELKQHNQAQATGAQLCQETAPGKLQRENARLQAENEQLRGELQHEHELHVQNLADFESYRRRAERERAQAAQAGKRELILALLDVLDDLDRALAHTYQEPRPVAAGLRAIHQRLTALLKAQGVTAFDSLGELFDPTRHQVVGQVSDEGAAPGTVLDEVSRGWNWGEELLRPARVRVAQ